MAAMAMAVVAGTPMTSECCLLCCVTGETRADIVQPSVGSSEALCPSLPPQAECLPRRFHWSFLAVGGGKPR